MKIRTLCVGVVLVVALATPVQAQLNFTLSPSTQDGIPGSTLTFSGTLTNTGSIDVFLNGDQLGTNNPLLTCDDSPFIFNAPLSLSSGQSYTGALFTVAIDPSDVAPDSGSGSFTIIGGADANAQLTLATQNFKVNVVPGPSSLMVLMLGAVPGASLLLRRHRLVRPNDLCRLNYASATHAPMGYDSQSVVP